MKKIRGKENKAVEEDLNKIGEELKILKRRMKIIQMKMINSKIEDLVREKEHKETKEDPWEAELVEDNQQGKGNQANKMKL